MYNNIYVYILYVLYKYIIIHYNNIVIECIYIYIYINIYLYIK